MKASRILFIFVLLSMTIGSSSCKWNVKNNSSSEDSTKVDTLWNAKVQDTFFDTKFGASREEVIKNFAKHGFTLDKEVSREDFLAFDYSKNVYNFGGMIWESLSVGIVNGKFQCIEFYTPTKDKATAFSNYNSIVDAISEKYQLTSVEPKDSTVYAKKCAFSKSPYEAGVGIYRYESISKEIYYAAILGYKDNSITEEVSDEL